MKTYSSPILTALGKSELAGRKFIWIDAKDRNTGAVQSIGFWEDLGTVTATVVDGLTGNPVARNFTGSGTLITIGNIPLTADVSIRKVSVKMSPLDPTVEQYIRGYDVKNAPIQIYFGLFVPGTTVLIDNPVPLFVGFVDGAPIVTARAGDESSVELQCTSHSRELTRANSETRSHSSQIRRSANDTFYDYTGVMADRQVWWGSEHSAHKPKKHDANKGGVKARPGRGR